jgi:hypothetical protein
LTTAATAAACRLVPVARSQWEHRQRDLGVGQGGGARHHRAVAAGGDDQVRALSDGVLGQTLPAVGARPPPTRSARFPPFGCAWSRSTAMLQDDLYMMIVNPLLWIS